MATPRPLFVVDAFTSEAFSGNPAAICLLDGPCADDAWMRSVAAEMRHSETAFLRVGDDPASVPGDWSLRWFTPAAEVDLCGHATLAAAHVLWTEGLADPDATPLRFHTRSGVLTARPVGGRVQLDLPALAGEPVDPRLERGLHGALAIALGAQPVAVERNAHDLLVELADARTVRLLDPDLSAVAAIDARGIVVTATSDDPAFDFVSRFFAPRVGVREDPVTGSAHCALAPYWAPRIGRADLVGRQVSARGGTVHCTTFTDDDGRSRVLLSGSAVTVSRGQLLA